MVRPAQFLSFTLSLLVVSSSSGFTPSRTPVMSRRTHLPSTFDLFADNNQGGDAVLREFEKKEELYNKKAQAAKAKLSEYETNLQKLQTKKAEYMEGQQLAQPPVGGSFSETTLRSAVKAFCWRVVAGTVTFITTLQFSGSVKQAFQVVGADFFSKAFTMFLGERLMNQSQAGREQGGDNAGRSLAKALIWRVFAIANTLTMAVFVSKDLSVASKIASTDAVFKTGLMFFYERIWARIGWGTTTTTIAASSTTTTHSTAHHLFKTILVQYPGTNATAPVVAL